MHLLLTTKAGDHQAYAVAYSLEGAGHSVSYWFPSDVPEKQLNSIYLTLSGATVLAHGPQLDLDRDSQIDVVWHRRHSMPVMPAEMHPADVPVAEAEFGWFLDGFRSCLAPDARWVNPLRSYAISSDKVLQLKLAPQCGFDIPETLVSHDPAEIRSFAGRHCRAGVIFKSFAGANWSLPDGGSAAVSTTLLSQEDLNDNYALANAPGIYQPYVEKAYELRVTMFGDYPVAVRINSQETEHGKIDWRGEDSEALRFEPYAMPPALTRACIAMMRELGIVFGAFDFIVTPAGDIVFLEVNPMGNCLPIENTCPETRMLSTFCDFLLHDGAGSFSPATETAFRGFSEVENDPAFQAYCRDMDSRHTATPSPVVMEAAE